MTKFGVLSAVLSLALLDCISTQLWKHVPDHDCQFGLFWRSFRFCRHCIAAALIEDLSFFPRTSSTLLLV